MTTPEDGLRAAGQRRVNVIWELTQSFIASLVVLGALSVCSLLIIRGNYVEAALQLISNAFFLVIGFYFGRTNHERTGGIGGSDIIERR
jgi:hypothetical protein